MKFHFSAGAAAEQLKKETNPFTVLLRHGSMSVEYYAPELRDEQSPHVRDELYIVVSGTGLFLRNGEAVMFQPGDLLFVPAGMEHRFENFSEDFAVWVVFYGPDGGEKP